MADAGRGRLAAPLAGADGVTFDLDDTLVSYRRPPRELLAAAFESVGVEPLFGVEAYHDRFAEFNDRTSSMDALREACFAARTTTSPTSSARSTRTRESQSPVR